MIYIRDLGLRPSGKKVIRNNMYALYRCNDCNNTVEAEKSKRNKMKDKLCRACTMKKHGKKVMTHGDSQGEKLYFMYRNMKNRCYREKNENFARYGGRGISVCEEWKNSYQSFREWALENGYVHKDCARGDTLSIDRIDVNGNYEPSNCQFIPNRVNSSKDQILFSKTDSLAITTLKSYFNFTNAKLGNMFGCKPTLISKVINNKATLRG